MKDILTKILLIVALLAVIGISVLFYFTRIKPNQKKSDNSQKENYQQQISMAEKGLPRQLDSGKAGFKGEIIKIDGQYVTLKSEKMKLLVYIDSKKNIRFYQGPLFNTESNSSPKLKTLKDFEIERVKMGDILDVVGDYYNNEVIIADSITILVD